MTPYTTKQHDMLDAIAYRHYGYHGGTVEAILEANRDLSELPCVLPAGITILLPDLTPASERRPVAMRLWD